MDARRKLRRWLFMGIAAAPILLVAALPLSASASPSGSGSAFGAQVTALGITVGPTPSVSLTAPGSASASLPSLSLFGVLSASTLSVSTQVTSAPAVSSAVDVAQVALAGGVVSASGVHASCSADANQASGSVTIAQLVAAGMTFTNISPGPNTTINLPLVGTLVLNQQTTPTSTSITVDALHLSLITGADIVVGQARCAVG